jgi:hypothetical protein
MKKEDLQNSQQGKGSAENEGLSRDGQKNSTTNISNNQENDISRQAGLGRHRMADIEGLGGMSRLDDYAGSDEDLTSENLNAANDQ